MIKHSNPKFIKELTKLARRNNFIDKKLYNKYDVKRGLRNSNGTGVLVGLTGVGDVQGYKVKDGEKIPAEGHLLYRGIDVNDIVSGCVAEGRHGFEEVAYLLMFGELPNSSQLAKFNEEIGKHRKLPKGFIEDMILKAPSVDIMNKLARSVLVLYSYDENPDDISVENTLRQSLELIARFPTLLAYGYQAKSHYFDKKSLFIHIPRADYSTAENLLHMIRPDNKFTKLESDLLDMVLMVHAEHGGGNNSTFAARVVSSTGTDIYSAIAAAVGSLKGPKHGGANAKVMAMIEDVKANVKQWSDLSELERYLTKIVKKEAFDRSGLIYGMGHAVYTLSDPRAVLLNDKAEELSKITGRSDEYELYRSIEKLAPEVIRKVKNDGRINAANVDFYSGFIYSMMNIPEELYTPLFAVSRIAGWCAHRIEELVGVHKIMRPAYKSIIGNKKYLTLNAR